MLRFILRFWPYQPPLYVRYNTASVMFCHPSQLIMVRWVYSVQHMEESGMEVKSIRLTIAKVDICLLYTSPSPRDRQKSRMPSSA